MEGFSESLVIKDQISTTASQAASVLQEACISTESSLTALEDALLAYIISFLRRGPRRQLRAVCHRFKALVDQQITKVEMDLTIFSDEENYLLVQKAALLWPGTRYVLLNPGKGKSVSPAVVGALASCEWPKLEIIKFKEHSSETKCAASLASSRGFPTLRELHFFDVDGFGGLSTGEIEALSEGLHWANLEVLEIGYEPLGLNGGVLLARLSHAMPALRSLSLRNSNMSNANLKDFCEGSWTLLTILNLRSNNLGPESGAIFAEASKTWSKLRQLDISYNTLTTNGLEHFLQGHWSCLEKLGLRRNELNIRAGAVFADASHRLPCMRELGLSENKLEDSGICAILEGHWPLIESLDLYRTGAGMGALSAFTAASIQCPQITELNFNYFGGLNSHALHTLARGIWHSVTKLDVSGGKRELIYTGALAEILAPHLPRLKNLYLSRCGLDDSGLKAAFGGSWASPEILDLSGNLLTHASSVFLAKASLNVLSGLKFLDLHRNEQLQDAGIEFLMEGNWTNMETLVISRTGMVGSRGAKAIASAAPRLPKLRKLCVEGNRIDRTGSLSLVQAEWAMIEEMLVGAPTFSYKSEDMQDKLQLKTPVQMMKAAANLGGFKLKLISLR